MNNIARLLNWFYHEFGLASIQATGRNAYFIILARTCRMFAFGTNSLILAIFFSALKYSDHAMGIFMTLTMLGDVVLGTYLTIVADRIGRRRVLMGGSILMILSGLVFSYFENFFILLVAAVLGVISITGGDFGPFRSIEESIISQLTTSSTRTDVLTWYVATSTLGSSLGSEVSGRLAHVLKHRDGWTDVDAYHSIFLIYTAMGVVNALLVFALTKDCELKLQDKEYSRVALDENEEVESSNRDATSTSGHRGRWNKVGDSLVTKLFKLSAPTRSVMYRLWFLLAVDALADGMVPYSLTNYFMDIKFHPSTSTLGDLTSVSYFIAFFSSTFASPLARRIGLINTMVFTHVPSSAAVLLFPFPPYFWMVALLLLIRTGLNPMDQAPRAAFIAAVVKPEEVTAAMGITATVKTVASMAGPTFTGLLAEGNRFWIAFVVAGTARLAYDFGLWAMFVNMQVDDRKDMSSSREVVIDGDAERLEMASLADSDDSDEESRGSGSDTVYGDEERVIVK